MGKKSKRSRSSGTKVGSNTTTSSTNNDSIRAAPALRPAKEEEEETMENLKFEDPYEDLYEDEEADDDEINNNIQEMEEEEAEEAIQSWNPLTSNGTLPPNTSLVIDETAYKMHHALTTEWPSLSFDVVPDEDGRIRTKFPHSLVVVAGSQADRVDRNKVTVMKLSDLGPCAGFKSQKEMDDEILGEEYNPDADSDSDDDEEEEEEEEDLDVDPILEHYSLSHHGGVNRIRVMPQQPSIVSTWSDAGTVNLYNIESILATLNGSPKKNLLSSSKDPFFVYSGHSTEGYAMDWSKVTEGNLATGDCDGSIHIWNLASSSTSKTWTNSSFNVTPTYSTPTTNAETPPSIEDIQWSPTESTVLATGECGGYVRIYDTRCSGRPMLSTDVTEGSGVDVNVIAWNGLVSNLLASGADDGTFSVWDLRNFQSSASSSSPPPLARFTAHKKPITSLEWHPTDESMIAVSDEDGTYVYDLSIEEDEDVKDDSGGEGLPPQLLFVHCGSTSTKEVHWHPQVVSCLVTTSLSGFSAFIPSNL